MKKLVLLLAVIASVSFFSCNKGAGSASAVDSDSVAAVADSDSVAAPADSDSVAAPAAPAAATDSAAVKA